MENKQFVTKQVCLLLDLLMALTSSCELPNGLKWPDLIGVFIL